MSKLEKFLNAKPLYYDEIDYTRMPRVYKRVKEYFKLPKVIHLIGTNGKGTTGRFLASALCEVGHSVGHYTSPHILNFSERIWINFQDVSEIELDEAHETLLDMLTLQESNSLSYFEYTTLLSMKMFEGLEYVVLEAGLGGEHDATAVFAKILTLVTPIDKDHEAFLGTTIKEIATTKLRAIQNSAIIGEQKHQEVYETAKTLAVQNSLNIFKSETFLEKSDKAKIEQIRAALELPKYLTSNLELAIAALRFLKIDYKQNSFNNSRLFGRLSQLNENIIIDVGHNTLAADAILKALLGKKYILVYNSYKDKSYKEILKVLKPLIKHVEIIEIQDKRIVPKSLLQEALMSLGIEYRTFLKVHKEEKYLVFGSFSVVEEFLRSFHE